MRDNISRLVASLTKTSLLAAAVGGISVLLGHAFWPWFLGVFLVQFFIFYVANIFLEYKAARDLREFQIKEASLLAVNSIKVICASCKRESEVQVRTDEENRYTCGYCKVKNSIFLRAETAVVTEPMYEADPLPNTQSTNGN